MFSQMFVAATFAPTLGRKGHRIAWVESLAGNLFWFLFAAMLLTGLLAGLLAGTSAHAQDAARGAVVIEGVGDEALRARIARFIPREDAPPDSAFDALRRAEDAAKIARQVLDSEGYFAAEIVPGTGEGPGQESGPENPDSENPDSENPDSENPGSGDPNPGSLSIARLTIDPGPVFTLAGWRVEFVDSIDAEREAELRAGLATIAPVALNIGAPARSVTIFEAEAAFLAFLRQRGHADSFILPRIALADHAVSQLQVTFRFDAGAPARLGPIEVSGASGSETAYIRSLAGFSEGDPWAPEKLADFQTRITGSGLFTRINVTLAPPETTGGNRSVLVAVEPARRRTIGLAGTWSTSEGFGLEASWQKRGLFGRADTLTLRAQGAGIEQSADAELARADAGRVGRTLRVGLRAANQATEAFDNFTFGLRVGADQAPVRGFSWFSGGTIDRSNIRDVVSRRQFVSLGGALGARLDRSDDALQPGQGFRLDARVEPFFVTGDDSLFFARFSGGASTYLHIPGAPRLVAALRARAGTILGASLLALPADRRFFAGGGGSVRGFSFQAIAPRDANNAPIGGKSFTEQSVELRRAIGRRWGVAAFVDSGSAEADARPGFDNFRVGAGAGLRYDAGFGPLRFDLATPLDRRPGEPRVQIYLSIGQAF